jgi:hypothetical protein
MRVLFPPLLTRYLKGTVSQDQSTGRQRANPLTLISTVILSVTLPALILAFVRMIFSRAWREVVVWPWAEGLGL